MTTQRIRASRSDFRMEIAPDPDPDVSYLEQEGFEDRLAEFNAGAFSFVGVRAALTVEIPHGTDGTVITHDITSPGVWGIEDDSGNDYLKSIFEEESEVLASMLESLGVDVTD